MAQNATARLTQKRVLSFIEHYIDASGFPPTIREIQDATGLASTSTVKYHLDELVDAGKLTRQFGASRGIALLAGQPRYDVIERLVKTPTLTAFLSPVRGGVRLSVAREFLDGRASFWVRQPATTLCWYRNPQTGDYESFDIYQFAPEIEPKGKIGYVMLITATKERS